MTRRLNALRNLAERPGTPSEGAVARRMYEREKAKQPKSTLDAKFGKFADFMRSGSMDDLADAVGPHLCDCGTPCRAFTKCGNHARHEQIRTEIKERFPRGTRVYYNKWAYDANCTATVTGYPDDPTLWNWIKVKFDHLKSGYRTIPIRSEHGWHISTAPIIDPAWREILRGGME